MSEDSDKEDDDDSIMSEDMNPDNHYNYGQMPLPKMTHKSRSGFELFALEQAKGAKLTLNEGPLYDSLDTCLNDTMKQSGEMFSITQLIRGHRKPRKRLKSVDMKPLTWVKFNTRGAGKAKPVMLRALLDSGGSAAILAKKHASKLKVKKNSSQKWIMPAGVMTTTKKA